MDNNSKLNQPVGWNLPAPVQPGYPAPVQPGYAAQSGYPAQPGYHVQQGYIPQQPREPPSQYPHPVPVVEIQSHTRPDNDPEAPKNSPLPENFGNSFSTIAIRHAFIRKVYAIVCTQLLVTLGFVALFSLHDGVRRFVQQHMWVYILSYVTFLATYITLICCSAVRRKWPTNMIMLGIFTLSMSYILGAVAARYETEIVIMSIGITTIVCFLITLFAVQTKFDFTGCGVYLFIASLIVFMFGIMAIFMGTKMNLVYSGLIVLLFSMYLIFDTQRIVGGRKHDVSAEEHIYGALVLYIDVVMIFLGILGISRYT